MWQKTSYIYFLSLPLSQTIHVNQQISLQLSDSGIVEWLDHRCFLEADYLRYAHITKLHVDLHTVFFKFHLRYNCSRHILHCWTITYIKAAEKIFRLKFLSSPSKETFQKAITMYSQLFILWRIYLNLNLVSYILLHY